MKALRYIAIATVFGLGSLAAGTASADGLQVLQSETWSPGYYYSDAGHYVRIVPTEQEEAEYQGTLEVREKETWSPGYYYSDNGHYVRTVPHENPDLIQFETAAGNTIPRLPFLEIDQRNTWAPGYQASDNGMYEAEIPHPME